MPEETPSTTSTRRRLRRIPDELRKRGSQSCDLCRNVRVHRPAWPLHLSTVRVLLFHTSMAANIKLLCVEAMPLHPSAVGQGMCGLPSPERVVFIHTAEEDSLLWQSGRPQ